MKWLADCCCWMMLSGWCGSSTIGISTNQLTGSTRMNRPSIEPNQTDSIPSIQFHQTLQVENQTARGEKKNFFTAKTPRAKCRCYICPSFEPTLKQHSCSSRRCCCCCCWYLIEASRHSICNSRYPVYLTSRSSSTAAINSMHWGCRYRHKPKLSKLLVVAIGVQVVLVVM